VAVVRMIRLTRRWKELVGGESGQGLVLAAAAMVAIVGVASLVIDAGGLLQQRRELQSAADAAALAGVRGLPWSPSEAISDAEEWAAKNGIAPDELESVEVGTTYDTNDTLTVTVRRDVPFLFGRIVGVDGDTVRATATARVGSPGMLAGLRPFGVLESAIHYGAVTTLKYDANNVTSGNFGPLAIDGTGSSVYKDTIEYGSETALCSQAMPYCPDPSVSTEVSTEPGGSVGPTRQGVRTLLNNTGPDCDEFSEVMVPDDSTEDPEDYLLTDRCNPFQASPPSDSQRVIIAPVIDQLCNGSCDVTILYFAMFFLEDLPHCTGNACEVQGRFVKANVDVGGLVAAYNPNTGLVMWRLVQ